MPLLDRGNNFIRDKKNCLEKYKGKNISIFFNITNKMGKDI